MGHVARLPSYRPICLSKCSGLHWIFDFSGPETLVQKNIETAVQAALDANAGKDGALLEVLHHVQGALGFIPAEAVPPIGAALNLSRAEVQGVIGFYHDYRTEPAGETVLQVCRAEACKAMGVRELEAHIHQRLGIHYHETTPDGRYTLEPVYCLGNCACTPSLRIGDTVHARVTPERFDELVPLAAGAEE